VTADGTARSIPGSPFSAHSNFIAADPKGRFLFGSDSANITTYNIGTNGALSEASNLSGTFGLSGSAGGPINTDQLGQTLYNVQYAFQANSYAEFSIGSSGALQPIGTTSQNIFYGSEPTFAHDDGHAYSHACQITGFIVSIFDRQSDGTLEPGTANAPQYSGNSSSMHCPVSISASPTANRIAVAYDGSGAAVAVYSIAADGSGVPIGAPVPLPAYMNAATTNVLEVAWDSSGNYLAIATTAGVQIYQVTDTGLTAVGQAQGAPIRNIRFDNQEHLIGLGIASPSLYIFNFKNGHLTAAPGSPHPLSFAPVGVVAVPQSSSSQGTGS
jgi:hypothetical protein